MLIAVKVNKTCVIFREKQRERGVKIREGKIEKRWEEIWFGLYVKSDKTTKEGCWSLA